MYTWVSLWFCEISCLIIIISKYLIWRALNALIWCKCLVINFENPIDFWGFALNLWQNKVSIYIIYSRKLFFACIQEYVFNKKFISPWWFWRFLQNCGLGSDHKLEHILFILKLIKWATILLNYIPWSSHRIELFNPQLTSIPIPSSLLTFALENNFWLLNILL